MDPASLIVLTLLLLIFLFILYSLLRAFFTLHKKKLRTRSDESTHVSFVVDTFHDLVTKLKEKEKELDMLRRNAEERAFSSETYNENILQSVPSGVLTFDRELRMTKMNSSAEKILELNEPEMIGKRYDEIFSAPITGIIMKEETIERGETAYITRNGKRVWLGLSMSPLKDSAGNVIGRLLVFTDLSELKAFQSQMELRERLATLGEMSAGIAHEMRNPMAVISGYTKILSKKVGDSEKQAVEAISREVAVMDRIITDFLSFAKPTELVLAEVNLEDVVEGCLDSLRQSLKGIRVERVAESCPLVSADEILLRQAITNIIQNAIESMPQGGLLSIRCDCDDQVSLEFSDTGHGIPDAIKDKIFLPFYTTKERGTGLGLSIVHKIIVSHGGNISVDTGEKGTTFTIKLPSATAPSVKKRKSL